MNPEIQQTANRRTHDILLLTLAFGVFFLFMIGNRPLSVPDEGRYVEIPREMVATGDYVTPRLNGVKYFEKPVLLYWLESASIKLFGLKIWALRFWPALFALIGCLAVYVAGRKLYCRRTGIIAAAVLATNLLYYALSRVIILDMPVSALLTVSLLSFLLGTHEPPGTKRRLYFWSFYAFMALATLTKGLIGILIPAMAIGAWIIILNEWRMLRMMYLPTGLVLFLLISAPWHILVGRANPEFFNFYFVHEHFVRYLTKVHNRYQPFWYFIPIVIVGLFPWSVYLVQAVTYNLPASWRERHEHRDTLFLLLWAGLVFLFFSASDSKLIPYILPVFPPLALLIGRYFAAAWNVRDFPGIRTGTAALLIVSAVLCAGMFFPPRYLDLPDARKVGNFVYAFAVILLTGTVLTWFLGRHRGFRWAFAALCATIVVFLLVVNGAASRADTRSIKSLADTLKARLHPGDEVASYETYYQDLPVYLERRIIVVDWKGELEFGTTVDDAAAWMIDDAAFWKKWQSTKTVYMLTKRETYDVLMKNPERKLYLVAQTDDNVLVANKEMKP